jgi:hypothetical protein
MEILISGIPYQINLIEPNTRADENMGRCDVKLGLITIQRNMPDHIQFSTLIHEVIEAINDMNELGMKHNVISSLSTHLAEVLINNKIDDFKILR